MKIKLLDRPPAGPAQDAWDAATQTLRDIEFRSYLAANRRQRGSRKSRRLFHDRVVMRAMRRDETAAAEARSVQQKVGLILEVALTDFVEETIYSTINLEPIGDTET